MPWGGGGGEATRPPAPRHAGRRGPSHAAPPALRGPGERARPRGALLHARRPPGPGR